MDRYISDDDLDRFTRFLNIDRDVIRLERDIVSFSDVESLFNDTNSYFTVLFKENPDPNKPIGHWTCLIKHDDETYEYFDCLGDPVPPNILEAIADGYGVSRLDVLTKPLMKRDEIICGKWVISRILAAPSSLREYFSFFTEKVKGMNPDEVIDLLFNIPT